MFSNLLFKSFNLLFCSLNCFCKLCTCVVPLVLDDEPVPLFCVVPLTLDEPVELPDVEFDVIFELAKFPHSKYSPNTYPLTPFTDTLNQSPALPVTLTCVPFVKVVSTLAPIDGAVLTFTTDDTFITCAFLFILTTLFALASIML